MRVRFVTVVDDEEGGLGLVSGKCDREVCDEGSRTVPSLECHI